MRGVGKFNHLILIAAIFIVAGLGMYLLRPKEPSYQGRTLTEWSEKYYGATLAAWGRQPVKPSQEDCQQAIRTMGTNVIPFLLRYQTVTDTQFKARARAWLEHHPSIHVRITYPEEWHAMGMLGFSALGTNALDATPALIQLAKSTDAMKSSDALTSLEYIHPGEEFTKLLVQLFQDTGNPQRSEMGFTLSMRDVETAERVGVFKEFPKTPRGPKKTPNRYLRWWD